MDITELKRTLKGTFEGLYDYRLHLREDAMGKAI